MSLQDVFYTLGIIFMLMSLVILIGLSVIAFMIMRKIQQTHHMIESKIKYWSDKPLQMAGEVGSQLAQTALRRMKKTFGGEQ